VTEVLYYVVNAVSLVALAVMVVATLRERDAIRAVARHTWKEALRSRALWLIMLFIVTLLFAITFLEATGAGIVREERRIRVILETSLRVMTAFAVLTAIFATSMSLPSDITDRRVFTLLSKPVSRWGLICGKALGFSLFTFAMLVVMGLCMAGLVRWTARNAPREVKQRLLGARELIRADRMTLLTRRRGEVADEHVLLTMRPEIPRGSMYRFEFTDEMMKTRPKSAQGIPARFKFRHLTDPQGRALYKPEELKTCDMVFEVVEPGVTKPGGRLPAKTGPQMEVKIDPETSESETIYLPEGYFTEVPEGQGNTKYGLGIRVLRMRPATRGVGKMPFVREAENAHWEFHNLHRAALEVDPPKGEGATDQVASADGASSGSSQGKRIQLQVLLRFVNRSQFYTGARYEDLRFWYRLPNGKLEHATARARDARLSTFTIPADAIAPDGTLVLDLENPMGTSIYYGYDNENYSIFVLSAPKSFEFNVLKAVTMVSFQVVLLVVVSVSVSTFLSWPVAALTGLFVYFCGEIVSTFGEMIDTLEKGGGHHHHHGPVVDKGLSAFDHVVKAVLEVLRVLMPDMDKFSPLGWIGEGYSLTFFELFASFLYMNVFVAFSLAVGWLIFRKRSID